MLYSAFTKILHISYFIVKLHLSCFPDQGDNASLLLPLTVPTKRDEEKVTGLPWQQEDDSTHENVIEMCEENFFFDINNTGLCRPICGGEFLRTRKNVHVFQIACMLGFLFSILNFILAFVQRETL